MTAHRDKRTLLGLIIPLKQKGSTLNQIALEVGLSRTRVVQLLALHRTHSPVDCALPDHVGLTPEVPEVPPQES
jgi:hypothetical protein